MGRRVIDFSILPYVAQGIFLISLVGTCRKILQTRSSKDFSIISQTLTLLGIGLLLIYTTKLMLDTKNSVLFVQNLLNFTSNTYAYCLILKYRNGVS